MALVLLLVGTNSSAYRYKHEVMPGETLRQIAKRYHITVRKLRKLNRLWGKRKTLRAFRKLRIVTSVPVRVRRRVRYIIRKKDTLSKIAERHRMKLWLLKRLNRGVLRRRKVLSVGRKLWVLAWGPKPTGSVKGLYQLETGPGFIVRNPQRSWGTFTAVMRIASVFADYSRYFPKAKPVKVWDLSKRGGGYLSPHVSHRRGRDVDIPYVLKAKYKTFRAANARNIDLRRSWFLIKRFVDSGDVKMVFIHYWLQRPLYRYAKQRGASKKYLQKVFQFPRGSRNNVGMIRHEPGHATHFHVRFKREKKRKPNS
ncbi:MAG: penicillin-insensitive murein endopeptidase [Myxococcales bacterium]|nr:penicillin-insensitive murein endopeptidase [Myxococcales bacterium]